ncbi:hypothetical protein BGZ70_007949 [Mortierella alpina]|uniref:Uncharacterized protein n=1 Tax=Mortierella alpina TaxID=64518 RepID=A0A9P6J4N9_MORAP|nr:hypothetical protein BGZ70_007949 [Mortierella alpina]
MGRASQPILTAKYQAPINVEICTTITAVKGSAYGFNSKCKCFRISVWPFWINIISFGPRQLHSLRTEHVRVKL